MLKTAGLLDHFVVLPAEAMNYCNASIIPVPLDKFFNRSGGVNLYRFLINRSAHRDGRAFPAFRGISWRKDALMRL
jgi:hypothetical protein